MREMTARFGALRKAVRTSVEGGAMMTDGRTERGETGGKVDVLDHGFVRLVASMGNDLSIVRAARVSYDADWRTGEDEGSDARLIHYLWKNQHTSPFEAVEFQFEVKAPIFVLRQWHRHRTWSYNELSARYGELSEEFYLPKPDTVGEQSASRQAGPRHHGRMAARTRP